MQFVGNIHSEAVQNFACTIQERAQVAAGAASLYRTCLRSSREAVSTPRCASAASVSRTEQALAPALFAYRLACLYLNIAVRFLHIILIMCRVKRHDLLLI